MTFFAPQPKPRPHIAEKREDKRDQEKAWRKVCRLVDERDKRKCRYCGRAADPLSTDPFRRGHRHHLKFRSHGGQDTTANMLLLCAEHHREVHAYRLFIVGKNANKTLRFEAVPYGRLLRLTR